MTKRFSDNLWTHIKLNYDNANGIYDEINKFSTELKDTNDELTDLLVSLCVISAWATLALACFAIYEIKWHWRDNHIGLILAVVMICVSLGILITTAISLENKNSEIVNN